LAKCVVEGIRQNKLDLVKFIRDDLPVFNPARPDSRAEFPVPANPRAPSADGN
jgi:hypothetical protein